MGEMVKFGIKLSLTIACAVALAAAIVLLFSLLSSTLSNLPTSSAVINLVRDVSNIIGICLPFDITLFFTIISSLFTFKVAYWGADKMIQFIDAIG